MIKISQNEILAFIIQLFASYLFVSIATSNAAKQNSIDSKRDLRTTKEDIMGELKDSREALLRESEISTNAILDVLKSEIQTEVAKVSKRKQDD